MNLSDFIEEHFDEEFVKVEKLREAVQKLRDIIKNNDNPEYIDFKIMLLEDMNEIFGDKLCEVKK